MIIDDNRTEIWAYKEVICTISSHFRDFIFKPVKSQGGHVVSSQNSIPGAQVLLPLEEPTEKKNQS